MGNYLLNASDLGALWADQVASRYGCECTRIVGDPDGPRPDDLYHLTGPGAALAFKELTR